jgi:hypothetical protein
MSLSLSLVKNRGASVLKGERSLVKARSTGF